MMNNYIITYMMIYSNYYNYINYVIIILTVIYKLAEIS